MPTDAAVLGFSNRWYPTAIQTAQTFHVAGHEVRVVTPALFIATKLDAFHGRGGDDVFASHDLEDIIAVSVRRAAMWVLGLFALTAVVLAAIGLSGVLAQAVAERTREIGIRIAPSATRVSTFGLVLRGALLAAGLGMLFGAATAAAGSRVLTAVLFGVNPGEPFAIAAAAVFLAVVAVIACVLPVGRAVRVNPADAVRGE